jgi:hypothetical protein
MRRPTPESISNARHQQGQNNAGMIVLLKLALLLPTARAVPALQQAYLLDCFNRPICWIKEPRLMFLKPV